MLCSEEQIDGEVFVVYVCGGVLDAQGEWSE